VLLLFIVTTVKHTPNALVDSRQMQGSWHVCLQHICQQMSALCYDGRATEGSLPLYLPTAIIADAWHAWVMNVRNKQAMQR